MSNFIKSCLFAFLCIFSLAVVAQPTISIQSTFKDITGKPIPDGNQDVSFKLYTQAEGGMPIWTQPNTPVNVQSGIYSYLLGSGVPLNSSDFGQKLFLGITPSGGNELFPRTELTHSPYAISVARVSDLGQSASFYTQLDPGWTSFRTSCSFQPQNIRNGNTIEDVDTGIEFPNNDGEGEMTFLANNQPVIKTFHNGPSYGVQFPNFVGFGGANNPSIPLAIGNNNTGLSSPANNELHLITDGIAKMKIYPNGRIYVGQLINGATGNENAVINVGNNSATVTGGATYFAHNSTDLISGTFGGPLGIWSLNSIATNQSILAATSLNFSDKRMKNIVGKSNARHDLETLKKIEITDYEHIDKFNLGNNLVKKVIAQQVESVLPNAVTSSRKVIPNVYEKASNIVFDNGTLTITTDKKHEFIVGDKIDLKCLEGGDVNAIEVTEVRDENTFTVKTEKDPKDVFVYGKYVDDFKSVDYDAIAMLNVSATQELIRKVEALEAANAHLNKSNDTLIKENKMLKDATSSIEARLQKLESLTAKSEVSTSLTAVEK